jgi:hypothetical protein
MFWTIILALSLTALGWNLYNLITGVQQQVVWWHILLACLGLLGALNGINGSVRSLLKF